MTYNGGTATDYLDLLDQFVEVLTSRHLETIAINAPGSSYAAGDVLSIDNAGSTRTHDAKIEVVSVSGGAITAARIYRGGAYTVDPTTTTGNATTADTGVGTGATFDLTFADTGWTVLTQDEEAASATVAAGGTGYTVGDDLTLVGGVLTTGGAAAVFNVDSVSGGVVTAVSLVTAGSYEVFPSNPVQTTVSPAGGSGCELTVTKSTIGGSVNRTVVLRGDAGAATDPLIAVKTYSDRTDETGANTVRNWALFSMTAWSNQFALHQQSNVSPGFAGVGDGSISTANGDGAFVPLKAADAFDIDWRISATGRRVVMRARVEGSTTVHYAQMSIGLLNPVGVTTEVPYPAHVAGSSDRPRVWYRDTSSIFGGISEVITRANGPMFVWTPEGSWQPARNAEIGGNQDTSPAFTTDNDAPRIQVWPLGKTQQHGTANDQIWETASTSGFDNEDLTLATGAVRIYRTPDSGGDVFPKLPVTIVQADSSSGFYRTFGELDGVFWFDVADSGASSQDRAIEGADAFEVVQNGTRVEPYSFLMMRED